MLFFFFKQKTAYELRISDWSSDVGSSDLARDAVSLTARREIAPLLLPDEFMGLKSLEGYIKFPEGLPTAPITLEPQDWPRVAEGRSEERRVGKEGVRTCGSRGLPYH